jgi:NADH-quinone oxidoreductase subunit N
MLRAEYLAVLPEIIMAAGGILVMLLVPLTVPKERISKGVLSFLSIVTNLAALTALLAIPHDIPGQLWAGHFAADGLGFCFRFICLLITLLTIFSTSAFLKREEIEQGEFYSLLLFSYLGMGLLAAGNDFLTTFIGLEVLSIASYAMLGFKRSDLRANESSLKYFILGSFSSAILLYGIVLIYGTAGSTSFEAIAQSVGRATAVSPLLVAGLGLVLVGFGFKLAIFPFQGWAPDVYEGAPTPVTGFMSVAPKAAVLAALIRILFTALPGMESRWVELLAWLAVATMTIGNLAALKQTNLKRMLAYSSIAHAGYMLVAFLTGSRDASVALLLYALAYALMNLGAFAIIALVSQRGDYRVNLPDYAGLGFRYPLLCAALTLFLLSLVGIPLTGGFMAKFVLFSAAVRHGWTTVVIIAVLNSVVSAYYYLRIVVYMYMKAAEGEFAPVAIPQLSAVAIAIAALGTLWLGLFPSSWLSLVQNSALALK